MTLRCPSTVSISSSSFSTVSPLDRARTSGHSSWAAGGRSGCARPCPGGNLADASAECDITTPECFGGLVHGQQLALLAGDQHRRRQNVQHRTQAFRVKATSRFRLGQQLGRLLRLPACPLVLTGEQADTGTHHQIRRQADTIGRVGDATRRHREKAPQNRAANVPSRVAKRPGPAPQPMATSTTPTRMRIP